MRIRQLRWLLSLALGLVAAGSVWHYLAPTSLGGSATYVVTHGVSMEPRFHTGDLAIVRRQSHYHVGEIVAYQNKMLGTVVLHRIVGREGARYLFKGDNNHFIDFEHPLASQLIGSLWLHIPGAGNDLKSVHSPLLVAGLALLGAMLLFGGAFVRKQKRRRRQRRAVAAGSQASTARRAVFASSELMLGALVAGLVALLPFVLLALLAFTRPSSARAPFRVPYEQSGTFSYSAIAPPGPAYPEGRVRTGDTLFLKVLRAIRVGFHYSFSTSAKHSLTGTASMAATISSSSGWHTTLPLGSRTFFRGDHAHIDETLDLSTLLQLIHNVQEATSVNGTYTLVLTPSVHVNGTVKLQPLSAAFAPTLQFTIDELEAQPLNLGSSSSTATGAGSTSPFKPSSSGSVPGKRLEPATLALGFASPRVSSAREIALTAIAAILCALAIALALLRRRSFGGSGSDILARYGRLIVPVERVWPLPGVPVIDVGDVDALASIAEHYDRSILHERSDGKDSFWVTDESGQFRYAPGAGGVRERASDTLAGALPTPSEPDGLDPTMYRTAEHMVVSDEQLTPPQWAALTPAEELPAAFAPPAVAPEPAAVEPQLEHESALAPIQPALGADLAAYEQATDVSISPAMTTEPSEIAALATDWAAPEQPPMAQMWTPPQVVPEPAAEPQPAASGWATPEQLPETFVLQDAEADAPHPPETRLPATMAFARFAGLEWANES